MRLRSLAAAARAAMEEEEKAEAGGRDEAIADGGADA